MKDAPSSTSLSVDSSVPLKTGSPVWLAKSAIISDMGATGALGAGLRFTRKYAPTPPASTTAAATPIHQRGLAGAGLRAWPSPGELGEVGTTLILRLAR